MQIVAIPAAKYHVLNDSGELVGVIKQKTHEHICIPRKVLNATEAYFIAKNLWRLDKTFDLR